MPTRFDIALSYSSNDSWIAKDLHDLLAAYGFKVYCYDRQPDESRGFLRESLRDIYLNSQLNILLWSSSHASAATDSFPAMERRFLAHRHINKGEAETLIPIDVDGHPLAHDLEIATVQPLRQHGILGMEQLVIDRMRHLRKRPTNNGLVFHPPPTDKYRSELNACEFSLHPKYQTNPLKRWQKLGDVWVRFPNPHGTQHVFMIPSGLCTVFLRHTARMRMRPEWIEAKRRTSIDFADSVGDRKLRGFWFFNRSASAPEREVVTIYCSDYDRYLNENFEKHLDVLFPQSG